MNSIPTTPNNQPAQARRIKAQRAAPGELRVYCVDLAKEYFHVNCYTANGELISSTGMRRAPFQKRVSNPQRPRA
jgi:hypothetical protein